MSTFFYKPLLFSFFIFFQQAKSTQEADFMANFEEIDSQHLTNSPILPIFGEKVTPAEELNLLMRLEFMNCLIENSDWTVEDCQQEALFLIQVYRHKRFKSMLG